MSRIKFIFTFLLVLCGKVSAQRIESPDNNIVLNFGLSESGRPYYYVLYKGSYAIKESSLGFTLYPSIDYNSNFEILRTEENKSDSIWHPVWGQYKDIRNNYKELLVCMKQRNTDFLLNVRFRVFDDGVGFRYEFPIQKNLRHFIIENELTEFALTGDHKSFWLPADYDTNEFKTTTSRLSEVRKLIDSVRQEALAAKAPSDCLAVQTPLMMKTYDTKLYINIHEAALKDYSAMHLNLDDRNFVLSSHLTPDRNGMRGYIQTSNVSPWRTIIISDDARKILSSSLILNLNEPCKIEDTSWIKPMKYVGVWWEYFTGGGSTWAYSDCQDILIGHTDYSKLLPNKRHGANTKHVKEYIDFASKHKFDAVLVEGWNEGWEDNYAYGKERIYSFTRPYPDFDVEELHKYSESKGVKLIMHHETTSSVIDYERQMDDAFRFMVDNGYNAVKTGYVGKIIPRSEYHDGQWMVNHYNRVVEQAAKYRIMVNSHEAVRPTGLCRTYPNWIAQESARGTEFESFNGNNPDHTTILPFTRLIGGPMDYTPGIFEGNLSKYGNNKAQLSTTLAKQLALYVVMYSPLQMAADLYQNYEKYSDAFQFIKDVAIDWDDTYILEAEPGDYITIARKEKNKSIWFVGGITDENSRTANIDFGFLPADYNYEVTIYSDTKDAHWKNNPKGYKITRRVLSNKSKIKQYMAPGGGFAITIRVLNKK